MPRTLDTGLFDKKTKYPSSLILIIHNSYFTVLTGHISNNNCLFLPRLFHYPTLGLVSLSRTTIWQMNSTNLLRIISCSVEAHTVLIKLSRFRLEFSFHVGASITGMIFLHASKTLDITIRWRFPAKFGQNFNFLFAFLRNCASSAFTSVLSGPRVAGRLGSA